MKKALIVTKNYLPGITKAGSLVNIKTLGDVEVVTISNTRLEEFGQQLTHRDIEMKTKHSLEEYDFVIIYVGENTPRMPVRHQDLGGLQPSRLLFVFSPGIDESEIRPTIEWLGYTISGLNNEVGVGTIKAPHGDENGVRTLTAIHEALLESGNTVEVLNRIEATTFYGPSK